MHELKRAVILALLPAATLFGQLTADQKISDFMNVAAIYAKNYGPYEWKRDTQNFDLLDIGSWLSQVRATTNDLDFYLVAR